MHPTFLIEKIHNEKKKAREENRIKTLEHAIPVIREYFSNLSVKAVYITGSLIKPFRFYNESDIDIAVEGLDESIYFKSISKLEEQLNRIVEIIELENCRFADSIKQNGLKIL